MSTKGMSLTISDKKTSKRKRKEKKKRKKEQRKINNLIKCREHAVCIV